MTAGRLEPGPGGLFHRCAQPKEVPLDCPFAWRIQRCRSALSVAYPGSAILPGSPKLPEPVRDWRLAKAEEPTPSESTWGRRPERGEGGRVDTQAT